MPEHGRYEALFKFITILLLMIHLDPDDKLPGRSTSLFVRGKAGPGDLFPARVRAAVVCIGMDGDTAARCEFAPDLDILRIHELDEVLHDSVHAILVEIAVIAE